MTPVEEPVDEPNIEPSVAGDFIEPNLQHGIDQEPREYE